MPHVTENMLMGSIATDQDSRLSWNEVHSRSAVKFAGEEEGEMPTDEEEEVNCLIVLIVLINYHIGPNKLCYLLNCYKLPYWPLKNGLLAGGKLPYCPDGPNKLPYRP